MNEIKFSQMLIFLREKAGLTQEQLGDALGVSGKTVSKWENGASAPDLSMLEAVADHFGVETDVLLGRKSDEEKTPRELIRTELSGLDADGAALKLFQIARESIPASFGRISGKVSAVPDLGIRNSCSAEGFYNFNVSSEDVSLAIMLMRSRSNFAFLADETSLERISELMRLLSDTDAIRICAYIHSTACSLSFTAGHVSRMTGVSEEKCAELLDRFCKAELCTSETAHLGERSVEVYESYGSGRIFALIVLAYEHMCGKRCYDHHMGGKLKMIEGNVGDGKGEK